MATACSETSNAMCDTCNTTQRVPGGACNRCPKGTLLTTNSNGDATCELCPAGFFCAPVASPTTSTRRLLEISATTTSQCAAGKMSGAGAVACVVDCGIGTTLRPMCGLRMSEHQLTRLGLQGGILQTGRKLVVATQRGHYCYCKRASSLAR